MMTMMKTRMLLPAIAAAALLMLSACGQKGPLYLPDDGTGATPAASDQPQNDNGDSEEDEASEEGNATTG